MASFSSFSSGELKWVRASLPQLASGAHAGIVGWHAAHPLLSGQSAWEWEPPRWWTSQSTRRSWLASRPWCALWRSHSRWLLSSRHSGTPLCMCWPLIQPSPAHLRRLRQLCFGALRPSVLRVSGPGCCPQVVGYSCVGEQWWRRRERHKQEGQIIIANPRYHRKNTIPLIDGKRSEDQTALHQYIANLRYLAKNKFFDG